MFQKRRDGSVDFFRAWDDYKRGFGNLNGEFWLGLDKINRLTVSSSNRLRVDLEDIHGKTVFAEYSSFSVASERAKYQLNLGSYSGKLTSYSFTARPNMHKRECKVKWHRLISFCLQIKAVSKKPKGKFMSCYAKVFLSVVLLLLPVNFLS